MKRTGRRKIRMIISTAKTISFATTDLRHDASRSLQQQKTAPSSSPDQLRLLRCEGCYQIIQLSQLTTVLNQ